MNNNKNGFTLVELLAVIVILAIILVIAVPKVMDIISDAKKGTLESTAKMIASAAEKQKVQNTILGKEDTITCESVAKLNDVDYESCSIEFNDSGEARVTIAGKGKFNGLYVCNGTKTNATAEEEECPLVCKDTENKIVEEVSLEINDYDKCVSFLTANANDFENIEDFPGVESLTTFCKGDLELLYDGWTFGDFFQGLQFYNVFTNEELIANGVLVGKLSCVAKGPEYMAKICEYEGTCSENNLMKDSDGNIRYIGDNPNNYISFNNEVWRIIGAFNVKKNASDTTTEMRLKIIRNDVLEEKRIFSSTKGTWGTSDLKTYLNGDYYNSLSSTAKGQIEKAVWNTGVVEYGEGTSGPVRVYTADAYGSEKQVQTESIVGLISVSDYAYANGNEYVVANSYYPSTCAWMCTQNGFWTIIMPYTTNFNSWVTSSDGYSYDLGNVSGGLSLVRPVVYLKSNVKLTGTGENTTEGIYRIS